MNDWCLEVWGDYACFTRPEMKVERVSYDVMTPSSARAIFEAIMWKPSIRWNVSRIEVLEPIRWISVRRNEVGRVFSAPTAAQINGESGERMGLFIEDNRQQRAGLFLRDVRYRIHAWFDLLNEGTDGETAGKYAAMFERRARSGQCFHRPYLGCREFACDFRLVDDESSQPRPIQKTESLGWMLYDMDFGDPEDPRPMFFRAELKDGVLNTDRRDPQVEVRG